MSSAPTGDRSHDPKIKSTHNPKQGHNRGHVYSFDLGSRDLSLGKALKEVFFTGWSGGAMVLGKLPVPGRPTIWIRVGQWPTLLAVGAGGGCLDIFSLISHICFFLPFGDGPI